MSVEEHNKSCPVLIGAVMNPDDEYVSGVRFVQSTGNTTISALLALDQARSLARAILAITGGG